MGLAAPCNLAATVTRELLIKGICKSLGAPLAEGRKEMVIGVKPFLSSLSIFRYLVPRKAFSSLALA